MKRFSKVSFDDIKTIQVDSGVLLKKFDIENPVFLPENVICATSGGINPVCVPEYYDFGEDVDNAKSLKETKRIRGWNISIIFTTLTTSLSMIKLALGAADISGKVLSLRQRLQYAKDFKDIWWVGKRADDKLIAIRLIRSLSDSGFSLQTTKKGKGQISVTLKGHSSFAEKDKIPMEVYIFAESDIPIVPDEPETPTASLYLYGTPSESGNIGLRVGESVTYYEGAVATAYPEWDSVPYVAIAKVGSIAAAFYSNTPCVSTTEGGATYLKLGANNYPYGASNYVPFKDGAWSDSVPHSSPSGTKLIHTGILWSNHDIADENGAVQFAKSADPVPVAGLVGYSYNGAILPKLPTDHQYTAIQHSANIDGVMTYWLYLSDEPMSYHLIAAIFTEYINVKYPGCRYDTVGDVWGTRFEYSFDHSIAEPKSFMWANHDILKSDGTTYLQGTEPILIYE